jgi:hypothetical protein
MCALMKAENSLKTFRKWEENGKIIFIHLVLFRFKMVERKSFFTKAECTHKLQINLYQAYTFSIAFISILCGLVYDTAQN